MEVRSVSGVLRWEARSVSEFDERRYEIDGGGAVVDGM